MQILKTFGHTGIILGGLYSAIEDRFMPAMGLWSSEDIDDMKYKQHSRFPVHGAFKFDMNTLLGSWHYKATLAIAMLMSHCCHHSLSDALHNDAQFVWVDYFAITFALPLKVVFSASGKLLLLLPS